ncbi:Dps family protein [Winogradskyella endarachnes]|uniref:DNA starvation/stationary phase protection protein n=1 Tax=Winogradskyella endarachnes TaxID=2681965 RepID=A0A6L6U5U4_9FLAO|nr:Dps family protein [Winogradskyella endarachnes]MUU77571.1 DNA starvation/stationary phase protection protein [Winogradskyella endarachnes]
MKLNSIGLDTKKTEELAEELNQLLANFQLYYQNLRGIHWNIQGRAFFNLHEKFEELYTEANLKVDEIAERILTLGATPLHTFDDYVKAAKVPIGKNVSVDEKAVELIVNSLTELLKLERSILENAGDANDEGTSAMMSDFITEQEKTVWMMKAWLGETV